MEKRYKDGQGASFVGVAMYCTCCACLARFGLFILLFFSFPRSTSASAGGSISAFLGVRGAFFILFLCVGVDPSRFDVLVF